MGIPVPPSPIASDRRIHQRVTAQFSVRYGKDDDLAEAQACDISPSGIGLIGPKQYPVGAEIELRFRAPGGSGDLITMKARVRHSTAAKMGLEFVNIPASDSVRILDMIKRLLPSQQRKTTGPGKS